MRDIIMYIDISLVTEANMSSSFSLNNSDKLLLKLNPKTFIDLKI